MAEEKKPEADKNAPKKAAAPRRTKAKTSSERKEWHRYLL